ncbi:hypothetical protein L6452_06042 [Arctium lappa]|uniref:Uncharacterized protein n=1 Tax=Arctium lappa TaxID=4217 RepID=A0ACB9EHS3_ARCLA|nr:hypothetical protein L6452_06042 [Arctium lappa]
MELLWNVKSPCEDGTGGLGPWWKSMNGKPARSSTNYEYYRIIITSSPVVIGFGAKINSISIIMSWLARSIANSLQIDGEDEDDDHPTTTTANDDSNNHPQSVKEQEFEQGSDPQTLTGGGVKGDLSEFTESLARQIWGVASFLAPPPPPPPPPPLPLRHRFSTTTHPDPSISIPVSGEEHDDDVSNSICEDSRFGAGNGVPHSPTFPNEAQVENDRDFVGVTEEVLAFAMNIAHHPETWLDFPLSEEEESDDFEMSDTQWNHSTLVEHLVPRLAALRIELCPIHMSESYFWKVYFVLLLPRLNKQDAVLLSTPQIVAARTMWMKELQMKTKPRSDLFEGNASHMLDSHEEFNTTSLDSPSAYMSERTTHAFQPTTHHTVAEKDPVLKSYELTITKEEESAKGASDLRVLPSYRIPIPIDDFDEDEDSWIHENSVELDGYDGPDVPVGADEDISFSDLEDDDCTMPTKSKVI